MAKSYEEIRAEMGLSASDKTPTYTEARKQAVNDGPSDAELFKTIGSDYHSFVGKRNRMQEQSYKSSASNYNDAFGGTFTRPDMPQVEAEFNTRQSAYSKLLARGHERSDIEMALQVAKESKEAFPIAQVAVGVIAPVVLSAVIPGPVDDAALVPAAIKSLKIIAGTSALETAADVGQRAVQGRDVGSFKENLTRLAINLGWNAGFEGSVGALRTAYKYSPFIKKTIPDAVETVEQMRHVGIVPSPSAIDERASVAFAEGISRSSFGGKEVWKATEVANEKKILDAANQIVLDIRSGAANMEYDKAASLFASQARRGSGRKAQMLTELFEGLYKQFDDMAPNGATVDMRPLKKFAADKLAENRKTIAIQSKKGEGLILNSAERNELQNLLRAPDDMDLQAFRKSRTAWLKRSQKASYDKAPEIATLEQINELAYESLFSPNVADDIGIEAQNFLKKLNSLNKAVHKMTDVGFDKSISMKMVDKPMEAATAFMKIDEPAKMTYAKKLITEMPNMAADGTVTWAKHEAGEKAWNILTGGHFANMVKEHGPDGAIEAILKIPERTRNLIYGKGNAEKMSKLYEQAKRVGRDNFGYSGKTFQLLAVTGAGTGILSNYLGGDNDSTKWTVASGFVAISPILYAYAARSPKLGKLLTAGFNNIGDNKRYAASMGKFIKAATEEYVNDQRAVQKGINQLQAQPGQQQRLSLNLKTKSVGFVK